MENIVARILINGQQGLWDFDLTGITLTEESQ